MSRILLVEDDRALGQALNEYLNYQSFTVDWATSFETALNTFAKHPYDCCLVDVGLPDADGFTLAQEIRRRHPQQPLLFLTARSLKADKLKGFALGADDYITKPVDEEELIARIRAVLRRTIVPENSATTKASIPIGTYTFFPRQQQLEHPAATVELTERESRLLLFLCQQEGQILSRELVLKTIWGQSDYFTRRSMDVFISRLRKYLRHDPRLRIRNVYGSGFILETRVSDDP